MIDVESFKNLSDFDNVLVVDANGNVIFYDMADLNILKELHLRPENFLGKHVTSFYKDLTNENSTLMNVLRSGRPLCNIRQEITTTKGNVVVSVNSTYPIKEGDRIIGAVEFSKHFFRKKIFSIWISMLAIKCTVKMIPFIQLMILSPSIQL